MINANFTIRTEVPPGAIAPSTPYPKYVTDKSSNVYIVVYVHVYI